MNSPFTLRTDLYPAIDPDSLKGSLTGLNALVTGSSKGIGKQIAIALATAGANVCITARNAYQVEGTRKEISERVPNVKIIGITTDVLKLEEQEKLVHEFHDKLGPVDILICNAGDNTFQPFHLTDAKSWWDLNEINVRAPVELTRLVYEDFRSRNSGSIVYTSSRAAAHDLPYTTAYNCAKTSITRFAGTLQAGLNMVQKIEKGVDNGVSVYSIHPGEISTDLHKKGLPQNVVEKAPYVGELMAKLREVRPKFQAALPAWTVVWLCAGKAPALRGKFVDCTRDVTEQAEAAAAGKLELSVH